MKYRQLAALGLSAILIASHPVPSIVYADDAVEAEQEPAEAPATEAPATEAPATEAPATEAPATEAPATEAPVTEAPATEAPATEAPVTEAPATEKPAAEKPATEAPSTEETQTEPTIRRETEKDVLDSDFPEPEIERDESEEAQLQVEINKLVAKDLEKLIEEAEEESETEEEITNDELIARQHIVTPPDISLEFRFIQVKKRYGIVQKPEGAQIYEKRSASSNVTGKLDYYGLCYVLEEVGSDWLYVESGKARGFMRAEDLVTGDAAERIIHVRGEENLSTAATVLERSKNSAYTYTHTTVYPVIADRVYGIAKDGLNIYESRQESSRVTGVLPKDGLCYILADEQLEWVFVESGSARGFVKASELKTGDAAKEVVIAQGESVLARAEVKIAPEDNAACYYTLTSVRAASESALLRSEIVNYAFRFLGNPYVWGGTSLTHGCDCSGFTQSIYADFGYSIPRVAEAQALYGMQIPVSSAAPGDLIFYAKNGAVYHVSMYIGDGQVIHAYGKQTGVTITGIGSSAVWATRIIAD